MIIQSLQVVRHNIECNCDSSGK